MEEEFRYGAYNEETTGIFRYVKVLHIGDYIPIKSYKGYDEFGYHEVRVLTDLFKRSTKIADFRFTGKQAKLAKRLKVGKFYKFAFSNVYQNYNNKFKEGELVVRIQQDVFDVYKIDLKGVHKEMIDLTKYDTMKPPEEMQALLKEMKYNVG